MAKIDFEHADDAEFVTAADALKDLNELPEWAALENGLLEASTRYIFGGRDRLEAFEVKQLPGTVVLPHAHDEDEIIYVLEGSLEVGDRSYPAGSAIAVPAMTLYGFAAGPTGLRYLNFRARASARPYISKSEFLAERLARRGP